MLLDMTPVLSGDQAEIVFDDLLPASDGEDFSKDDVRLTGPVQISGKVINRAGYMVLHLTAEFPYETHCARCFSPVSGVFRIETEKNVAAETPEGDGDDYLIVTDGKLDTTEPVLEEIALSFPSRILCREDCKGLCPKCGKDLNEGACGCPAHDPDPRLAILKNFKETKK